MITYFKKIIRAIIDGKKIPSIARLARQQKLYSYYLKNKDVFQNRVPWITFSALEFLEKYLKSDMKVFEFGGGGSTLFFAGKVAELVTVEHDPEWFAALADKLSDQEKVKWKGYLIQPEPSAAVGLDPSDPNHYASEDENFLKSSFQKYSSAIDQFQDNYFDIVVVDGRSRPACMMHSLKKVKVGGLLLLDNADRPYYLKNVHRLLTDFKLVCEDFGPVPYFDFFSQTNIYQKIH